MTYQGLKPHIGYKRPTVLTVCCKPRSQTPYWGQKTKHADNNADKHHRRSKIHHIAPRETNADLRVPSIIASRLAFHIAICYATCDKVQPKERGNEATESETIPLRYSPTTPTWMPMYQTRFVALEGVTPCAVIRNLQLKRVRMRPSSFISKLVARKVEQGIGCYTYISMW
jgi:hypothetical protein